MKPDHTHYWRNLSALLLAAWAAYSDLAGFLTIAALACALFVPQLNDD